MWMQICFICLGAVFGLISFVFLASYAAFTRFPSKTDRTLGKLVEYKYNRDVSVYDRKYRSPARRVWKIKNMTKTKYVYTVDGKEYRVKFNFISRPKSIPNSPWIRYIKRFPRISYVKCDDSGVGEFAFFVRGLLFVFLALMLILALFSRRF